MHDTLVLCRCPPTSLSLIVSEKIYASSRSRPSGDNFCSWRVRFKLDDSSPALNEWRFKICVSDLTELFKERFECFVIRIVQFGFIFANIGLLLPSGSYGRNLLSLSIEWLLANVRIVHSWILVLLGWHTRGLCRVTEIVWSVTVVSISSVIIICLSDHEDRTHIVVVSQGLFVHRSHFVWHVKSLRTVSNRDRTTPQFRWFLRAKQQSLRRSWGSKNFKINSCQDTRLTHTLRITRATSIITSQDASSSFFFVREIMTVSILKRSYVEFGRVDTRVFFFFQDNHL